MVHIIGVDMTTILLNECGDWAVRLGKAVIIGGADEIRQRWLIHIRTFLGEWFLDQNIGIAYFDPPPGVTRPAGGAPVTAKALTRRTLKDIFIQASKEVPGVLLVESVIVDELDVANRTASITVTAVIDAPDGDSAIFRYSGSIPPDGCSPGGVIELPKQIQSGNLVAWFDAQDADTIGYTAGPGTAITQVQNKAGAGVLDGTGGGGGVTFDRTAFGHRGAFSFSGSQVFEMLGIPAIRNPTVADTAYTVFVVKHWTKTLVNDDSYDSVLGLDGVNYSAQGEAFDYKIRDSIAQGYWAGMAIQRDGGPLFTFLFTGTETTAALSRDALRLRDNSGLKVELTGSIDPGSQVAAAGAPVHAPQTSGNGYVGADHNGANPWEGFIGEVLIYDGYLDDADMATVNGYLDAKWGT